MDQCQRLNKSAFDTSYPWRNGDILMESPFESVKSNLHFKAGPLNHTLKNSVNTLIKVTTKQQKNPNINEKKYKTEMCKNYAQKGVCAYRSRCRFAHGKSELYMQNPTVQNEQPRRTLCKNFWSASVCKYGIRCRFQHYQNSSTNKLFLSIVLNLLRTDEDHYDEDSRLLRILNQNTILSQYNPDCAHFLQTQYNRELQ